MLLQSYIDVSVVKIFRHKCVPPINFVQNVVGIFLAVGKVQIFANPSNEVVLECPFNKLV